jgi:hypothetical protein
MSVDVIMYKAQSLTDDELCRICDMNVIDLNEINGMQLKEYAVDETDLARLEHIMPLLKPVSLMHTQTDYKACFISNGMPEKTKSYSICHNHGGGCMVSFDGGYIRITTDELDKFTTTKPKAYYIVKRNPINADIDCWIASSLMNALKKDFGANDDSDLSYTPIPLKLVGGTIAIELIKMYDEDELYPSNKLAKFLLEMMRATQNQEDNVFIEFQN